MAHNQESYIKKVSEKFKNNSYKNTKFVDMESNISVECIIHNNIFTVNAYKHLYKNKNCEHCKSKSGRKNYDHEKYINDIKKIHGDTYDLTKVKEIKSSLDIIELTCKEHGNFSIQVSRLTNGRKCPDCSQGSEKNIISKFNSIHNSKYNYLEFLKIDNKKYVVVECNNKHKFTINIINHLNGSGCIKCKHSEFVKTYTDKLSLKHNNSYTYDLSSCNNTTDYAIITCKIHGDFKQQIKNHLNGQGCKLCADNIKSYSIEKFTELCNLKNNGLGVFYIIKCFNEDEEFYKYGITSKTTKLRYKTKRDMPYNYEIIHEHSFNAPDVYKFEQIIKKLCKDYKYTPKLKFNGSSTECVKFE